MKRFTVVWHPLAEDELGEMWNESPDKQAITDGANRIDQLLANDPQRVGSQVSERSAS